MRRLSTLILCLPIILAVSCDTGSRNAAHGGGPLGSVVVPEVRAVALYRDLVTDPESNFTFSGEIWVFVRVSPGEFDAPPELWVDPGGVGNDFMNTGYQAEALGDGYRFSTPPIIGSPVLYQVRGLLGSREVSSNIIKVDPLTTSPGRISLSVPNAQGVDPGSATLAARFDQVSWQEVPDRGHSPSYLLFLIEASSPTVPTWIVEPVARWRRYRFGDTALAIFRSSRPALVPGKKYALVLVGFDEPGWNRSTSFQRWFVAQ